MGGPRRTARESVDAVEEALPILRAYLAGERSVTFEGRIYRVAGAKPGPRPPHPIGVWLGAYGPRMLALTGRLADGWIPSIGGRFLADADVAPMHTRIDDGARRAGRDPAEIERVVNLMALEGSPDRWRDRIMRVAELGFETILVGGLMRTRCPPYVASQRTSSYASDMAAQETPGRRVESTRS